MGTNYYLYKKPFLSKVLELVGLKGRNEVIRRKLWDWGIAAAHPMHCEHIGKSSGGWCFALHVSTPNKLGDESWAQNPFSYVFDLGDWLSWFQDSSFYIANEYGDEISVDEMMRIIQNRRFSPNPAALKNMETEGTAQYYAALGGVPGPNNLARSRIDGYHCIGHGSGTWDLIVGEFS